MENTIFTQAAKILRERRNSRRWKAVVFCLAIMVIGATAWLLIRESQALTHSGDVLDCRVVVHKHTADCSDENGNLICGKADYVFHMHNDDCYDADGELVCLLEEIEPHEHDADCFETERILVCGYEEEENTSSSEIESSAEEEQTSSADGEKETSAEGEQTDSADGERELICTKEEHTHNDSCYEGAKRELVCGEEEQEGHKHDDSCYTETVKRELVCGEEEQEGHKHDSSCYTEEKTLDCTNEEEDHEHDDSCYTTEEKLTCGQEEQEGHKHDDSCYRETTERELTCGQSEGEGSHTHTDDCYEVEGGKEPTCGKEEHKHSEECYSVKESDSRGDETKEDNFQEEDREEESVEEETHEDEIKENEGHKHTDECYQTVRKLTCGKKGVHIHDDDCYDGDVLICEVPYVESVEEHTHDAKCFKADENKEYTATFRNDRIEVTAVYKKSSGIPEGAGLDAELITKASDAQHYEKRLKALEEAKGALGDEETLAALLQIEFFTDDERFIPEDTVQFTVRFLDDSIYAAGDTAKVACFDGDDVRRLIGGMDVDDEGAITFEAVKGLSELALIAEENEARTLTYECEDYIMTITLGAGTNISRDAKLSIDQITRQNSPVDYEQRLAALAEADGEKDIAMLLRVWISADSGGDTGLDERASVKVQFLNDRIYAEGDAVNVACFDGDDIRLISGSDIDDKGVTTFDVERLSELAFVTPEVRHLLTYECEDYIVTVDLGEETAIPEEAQLMVEQITAESDAEHYKQRLTELEREKGMLEEEEGIGLLLHMWISVDGEEIALGQTAKVTVQFLNNELYFDGDAVKAAHFTGEGVKLLSATDIDEENSTTFEVDELDEFAFITEDVRVMTCEGADFIVTVRFRDAAQIPEDAKLVAKRITEESDPEQFIAREDQLQEAIEDEIIALGALFDISFYDADDNEVEPKDTVDVKIRLLDRGAIEKPESARVAHFVEDEENTEENVKIIEDTGLIKDEEGGLSTSFQTESFSIYAITVDGEVNNEATLRKAVKLVQEKGDSGTVKLMGDIVFTKKADEGDTDGAMPINAGKTVTLDLNGFTITVDPSTYVNGNPNVTLFDIYGNLSIVDSSSGKEVTEKPIGVSNKDMKNAPQFNYDANGNHLNSMICYVTKSEVIDSSTGATRETVYEYTVSGHGAIIGSKQNQSPLLYVPSNGKLDIDDGVIVGRGGNRAVKISGGTADLYDCYLVDNTVDNLDKEGGGAVYCETGGTISVHDGTVISGNLARQGGGIYVGASRMNMYGGYITNNETAFGSDLSGQYGGGGGGIVIRNSEIVMEGGFITGNRTYTGGGGLDIEGNTVKERRIVGGFISSNYCLGPRGDGAGIAVYDSSTIEISAAADKKVYITNNEVFANGDWGGAGMFVGENSTANLYDTLITNNLAEGFGGGLSGCSTGRIYTNDALHGAAIFDNTALGTKQSGYSSSKKEDKTYTENNPAFWELDKDGRYYFQDCFTALYTELDNTMLGGGSEEWDGSIDGTKIDPTKGHWASTYIAGLTAYPDATSKTNAMAVASVYINGNHSVVHGGGIMCNGIMVIGQHPHEIEIISALDLRAKKKLVDASGTSLGMEDKQFSFTIYDWKWPEGERNILTTGTNDADGNISFDEFLSFDLRKDFGAEPVSKGVYTYYIKEDDAADNPHNIQIISDPAVYRMYITVEKVEHGTVANSDIVKYIDDVTNVLLEKGKQREDGSWEWEKVYENTNPGSNEKHPIVVNINSNGNALFTNTKSGLTRIDVEKSWAGYKPGYEPGGEFGTNDIAWVSVGLFYSGREMSGTEGYARLELNAENGWKGSWENLPLTGSPDEYTVREMFVGYWDPKREPEPYNYLFEPTYDYNNMGNGVGKVTITNSPKTYGFEFTKVGYTGADGNPVGNGRNGAVYGAKFKIFDIREGVPGVDPTQPLTFKHVSDGYEYSGEEVGSTATARITDTLSTNIEGVLRISNLWWGKYRIEEVEAPVGYEKVHDHIIDHSGATATEKVYCLIDGQEVRYTPWEVDEAGNIINSDAVDVCPVFAALSLQLNNNHDNGSQYFDYIDDVLIFTMIDPKDKYELPESGGSGTDYINIVGIGVMFGMIALIYVTYRRRKGEAHR